MDESPLPPPSATPRPCSRTVSKWSFKTVKSNPNGNSPNARNTLKPPVPDLVQACLSRAHLGGDHFSLSRSASPAASLPARSGEYLDHADSDSIMGEVQDRIREMEARLTMDVESVMPRMVTATTCRSGKSGEKSLAPWISTMENGHGEEQHNQKYGSKDLCFKVPFRPAVILTLALGALLACTLMFLPLLEFTSQLTTQTTQSYQSSLLRQFGLVEELTRSAAVTAHSNLLDSISSTLWDVVLEPPDRALDAVLGSLDMLRSFQPSFTFASEEQRAMIAYRAMVELQGQYAFQQSTSHRSGVAEFIYVGFTGREFAGASLACADANCTQTEGGWYDCPHNPGNTYKDRFEQLGVARREPLCSAGFPTQRPWFTLHSRQSNSTRSLRRMWSGLYVFMDGTLGFTKTAPVASCGNYSCLQGVVAADISLPVVSRECGEAFKKLQRQLRESAYSFPISSNNSAVFVVNHKSNQGGSNDTGWLIGSSGDLGDPFGRAEESSQAIVRNTARALLERFGAWDASALEEQQRFRYRAENESKDCSSDFREFTAPGCIEVGTASIKLDEEDRWLVVLVSPSPAFHALARSVETSAEEEFQVMEEAMQSMGVTILHSAAFAFLVTTALTVGIGCGLGTAVANPLKDLTSQLRLLGNLEFHGPGSLEQAEASSRIRDISEVQLAFCRLSRGIETFARFVPEPVVRNIIKGDCRASRLHVAPREVTIMFSDIRDFTTLSESMEQIDLIFLLTRYLSIMSRIVETFGGVVAEILGDGLLVYWNTPLPVEDHAVKACAAAVAMQQALGPLNYEMSECGLPNLAVRIGVNTGHVLSGTFGSDKKMKFGCMGDPVNLASRLEGLCKAYGVGVVCSGTTYDFLAESGGFICRKLDLVQVKGRKEAVLVYEVMGCDDDEEDEGALEISEINASEAESQRSSPSRRWRGTTSELSVGKTFSRDSDQSRRSRKSHISKVSEIVFNKSPSQAALDALEDSRQSLTSDPRFNWKQVLEQKQHRMAQKRHATAPRAPPASNPVSPGVSNPVSPGVSPCPRVSFALPPPVVATPDVDTMHDLARRYEMALEAYQGARFEEASDLAKLLLVDYPDDLATIRLSRLADQERKAPGASGDSLEVRVQGTWSAVSVMLDKE